jgi:hypothetical protein
MERTMATEPSLFGKTFDQQVQISGDEIANHDISPNRRVTAQLVFEPLGPRIRVTARDESHAILWGFVGCKEMLKEIHCPVAVYETLRGLVAEELQKLGSLVPDKEDPLLAAERAVSELEKTVAWLKKSLVVKKVSEATVERAKSIAQIAADANRQINLEATSVRGMKPRAEPESEE